MAEKTLLHVQYTDAHVFPAKPGFTESICFNYGVKWNETHLVPVGGVFGVVNSPSPFVDHNQARWTYTSYTVVMHKSPYGGGTELERWYKASVRDLTPEEITHFEALWKRLREESHAGN